MNPEMKNEIELLTDKILEIRRLRDDDDYEIADTKKVVKFKEMITHRIIPMIKEASMIIGRSGCSLNYYSNELAVIRDPKKRIFIQILFYPYGHSKVTLGVNAPFLQFAYSPLKENIKVVEKLSIKSDEASIKIDEIEIDKFAPERIEKYFLEFLRDVVKYNEAPEIFRENRNIKN
ncbi:MAG: hypothetical protein HGGPFJEG_02216 [Ignavibacteria bacterium]|nr:hypothetical protein [Ignavibacteria bacterium]